MSEFFQGGIVGFLVGGGIGILLILEARHIVEETTQILEDTKRRMLEYQEEQKQQLITIHQLRDTLRRIVRT